MHSNQFILQLDPGCPYVFLLLTQKLHGMVLSYAEYNAFWHFVGSSISYALFQS